MEQKTVRLDEEIHKRLGLCGTTGESYQDVIVKLLDFWDKHHKGGGAE